LILIFQHSQAAPELPESEMVSNLGGYKLYNIGDRTETCGTPASIDLGVDIFIVFYKN
jgi:hypothetical protein